MEDSNAVAHVGCKKVVDEFVQCCNGHSPLSAVYSKHYQLSMVTNPLYPVASNIQFLPQHSFNVTLTISGVVIEGQSVGTSFKSTNAAAYYELLFKLFFYSKDSMNAADSEVALVFFKRASLRVHCPSLASYVNTYLAHINVNNLE